MKGITPKFLDSPYLAGEPGNWRLEEGAPEELKKEFTDYITNIRMLENMQTSTIIELDPKDLAQLKVELQQQVKKEHIHF